MPRDAAYFHAYLDFMFTVSSAMPERSLGDIKDDQTNVILTIQVYVPLSLLTMAFAAHIEFELCGYMISCTRLLNMFA